MVLDTFPVLVPGLDAASIMADLVSVALELQLDPLQARCDGMSDKYLKGFCQGEVIGVGSGVFFDTMGPAFPVMLALIFLPSSYLLSGDMAIPLTLMVFIGAMMGTFLPGMFGFLGVVIVAVGIGLAIFLPIHKLRRRS